jgi:excisionase family DNA binding protein
MDSLLTVKQIAEKLGYSTHGIYKLVEKSRIPHIKIPGGGVRFNMTAIEAWLEKRTVKAKAS